MKSAKLAGATALALVLLFAGGCAKKSTQSEAPAVPDEPVDKGEKLFEEGKYDEARAYYGDVLQADSTDVNAIIHMGRIALRQDDRDEAVEWMEKALVLAPDSSNVQYWAATAYVVKLQKDNAFQLVDKVKTHINKAVELDSSNVDARIFLAGFLLNAPPMVGGSVDKAKEQAGIIVKYDPYRGNLFWAEIYKKEKNFEKAAQSYEAAAAAAPEKADPYYYLGMMYQGNERYDEAFAAFEKAVAVDPGATNALYQIGRTGVLSGENLDRAVAALKKYLETDPSPGQPTPANAHWRLGMCYELMGELEKARAEFETALALDPDDENARQSLENLGKTGTEGQ
ncbi:MAG: tetratricopeptide repeat protein [Candidatus Latescibacterota bacterium]